LSDFWSEQAQPGPDSATIGGTTIRKGSRVRLRPRAGGDVFDLALADRLAVVESIEEDAEGELHVTVTLDDDPGRDLGAARVLGHRFFFRVDEVEPVAGEVDVRLRGPRILVAGIGNVFLGDDGFGVEVARRLQRHALPQDVEVHDFGIRGMDLAYALLEDWTAAILLDATPRGRPPGTLYVIEPDLEAIDVAPEAHGMDPVKVLALAMAMGGTPARTLVLGCEPQSVPDPDSDEIVAALTEPVRAALVEAERMLGSLLEELLNPEGGHP
jgi:hydrogenase maturation protease